jgi:DNA-binding response OmpR family regulator
MRLLVVEDDPPLARALREGLRAQGFAVDLSGSAEHARDRLLLDAYDLLVLDLGLPGADGLSLLDWLRGRGQDVPVLVLTARGTVADRVTGLDHGADDYLRKPFALAELTARIRALLRRAAAPAPVVLRVADLSLDARRFEVRRAGVPVLLTAKEFSILEYLMRHAGELVTRTMLLEHCWDDSYDGLSNLVDVHVSRIRRKLEATGGSPLLRSVRGAGFILGEAPIPW